MQRLYPSFGGFLLGFAALLLNACGPGESPPEPKTAASPLVYEITNAKGTPEGWMLGTIHALPDGVEWRSSATEKVIDDADYLMVEVANLSDRAGIAKTLARLSTSTDLPDLTSRVGPQHRDALRELVDRSQFSVSDFKATETWAVALLLAQVGATGDPANGVDRAVMADFSGRDVVELEGAEPQLRIFDELAISDQRDLLEGVIVEIGSQSDQAAKLRGAWLAGDEEALIETTQTGIMADAELRDALLVQRNKDWTVKLALALTKPQKPLVAVGAAHLVGPDSVPAMLEERGYTVTRLPR